MKTGIENDSDKALEPPLKGYLLEVRIILEREISSPS
jgi:hypothetical protein